MLAIDSSAWAGLEIAVMQNMIAAVLRNLLTNAVKFTNKNGQVIVKTERQSENVLISVADNGIGIPDKIKEKLFKINRKVTQTGTENEAGTGLGLLLCSEFVKKHKGEIWVESEEGKGSTFKFTLPLENTDN